MEVLLILVWPDVSTVKMKWGYVQCIFEIFSNIHYIWIYDDIGGCTVLRYGIDLLKKKKTFSFFFFLVKIVAQMVYTFLFILLLFSKLMDLLILTKKLHLLWYLTKYIKICTYAHHTISSTFRFFYMCETRRLINSTYPKHARNTLVAMQINAQHIVRVFCMHMTTMASPQMLFIVRLSLNNCSTSPINKPNRTLNIRFVWLHLFFYHSTIEPQL